jgi:hypothetical protein
MGIKKGTRNNLSELVPLLREIYPDMTAWRRATILTLFSALHDWPAADLDQPQIDMLIGTLRYWARLGGISRSRDWRDAPAWPGVERSSSEMPARRPVCPKCGIAKKASDFYPFSRQGGNPEGPATIAGGARRRGRPLGGARGRGSEVPPTRTSARAFVISGPCFAAKSDIDLWARQLAEVGDFTKRPINPASVVVKIVTITSGSVLALPSATTQMTPARDPSTATTSPEIRMVHSVDTDDGVGGGTAAPAAAAPTAALTGSLSLATPETASATASRTPMSGSFPSGLRPYSAPLFRKGQTAGYSPGQVPAQLRNLSNVLRLTTVAARRNRHHQELATSASKSSGMIVAKR